MATAFIKNKVSSVAGQPVTALTNDSDAVYSTVTIELFNDGVIGVDEDAVGYVYIADLDVPVDLDKIDYVVIPPGGGYSKECGLLGPNEKIVISFNVATIRARVTGLKATAA